MSHPHRSKIRYVQKKLLEETGVKVSYNWILTVVDKHLEEAFARAKAEHKDIKDVLVDIIRPLNRHKEG